MTMTDGHPHWPSGVVFALRAAEFGSVPAFLVGLFLGSSHTSDFRICTTLWGFPTRMVYLHYISCVRYTILVGNPQLGTLPDTWRYRVSAGTGRSSVSILWLGEIASLICNFYLMWQHTQLSGQVGFWDSLACCWCVTQATNQPVNHDRLTSNFQATWLEEMSAGLFTEKVKEENEAEGLNDGISINPPVNREKKKTPRDKRKKMAEKLLVCVFVCGNSGVCVTTLR